MILPLNPNNRYHTHLVLSLVVESRLDYGDLDTDPRLLAWLNYEGRWAVALADDRRVAGIVCLVSLSDEPGDALLWLEVLPQYQHQGRGSALLNWAKEQSQQSLVIKSVTSAVDFYRRANAVLH